MSLISRIVSIGISIMLVLSIFYLVRRGKLKEKYAIVWVLIGATILFFAVFNKALFLLTALLGIKTPINTMFFLGIFFILIINLHYSLIISKLEKQNKKIVQNLALIEAKLNIK